jgi:hypothetical protein
MSRVCPGHTYLVFARKEGAKKAQVFSQNGLTRNIDRGIRFTMHTREDVERFEAILSELRGRQPYYQWSPRKTGEQG